MTRTKDNINGFYGQHITGIIDADEGDGLRRMISYFIF